MSRAQAALAVAGLFAAIASTPRPAAAADVGLCVEQGYSILLTSEHTPGATVEYVVSSTPGSILDFALDTDGPFGDPLIVPITHDGRGHGEAVFVMRGIALGATTLHAGSDETGTTHTLSVVVDRIASLELVRAGDPLFGANPQAGGGKRVFPDLDAPGDDPTQARRVRLRASTVLGTPGIELYFAGWDVDDPSQGDPSPDDDTNPDNFGTGAYLSAGTNTTDAKGRAEVDLFVSTQPGDNFRLAASCNFAYLLRSRVDGTSVVDELGRPLPTNAAAVSDLLTVWRRLHLEVDSMGTIPPGANELSATVARAQPVRRLGVEVATKLTLDRATDSGGSAVDLASFAPDEFAGGRIRVGGQQLLVLESSRSTFRVLPVAPGAVEGLPCTLVDDDNLDGDGDGDQGFEIPQPDLAFLQESDDPAQNWLFDAYIRPVHLPDPETDLPVWVSAPSDPTEMYAFDHAAHAEDPSFWVAYLLGGYQAPRSADADPDTGEPPLLGLTDPSSLGSTIFFETIRDATAVTTGPACSPAAIAVHEVGHTLAGLGHPATTGGGIMSADCKGGDETWLPESLRAIRSAPHP